jgi:glycosyltransferase involved in cell wall biosynthesis
MPCFTNTSANAENIYFMIQLSDDDVPLISVVITTYNYATFLPKAVRSVLNQTYPNVELIIIDDGSEDKTSDIIEDSWNVKYFFQENKGLSAARNVGFEKSSGTYIVFLDADDWFLPDALEKNYLTIKDKTQIAFTSGSYYLLPAVSSKSNPISVAVTGDHYVRLLQSNYIGMHAAVMYQRWVFYEFKFDETLKACEDYELYLAIARKHRIHHHEAFIATYYFHSFGMSHNYQLMIDSIQTVLKKQAPFIDSPAKTLAYEKGLQQWKDYDNLLRVTS